jgi:2-dehydro-3-deoxyphosphooctonate aldolase (KDO 8-P synthase)
MKPFLNTLFQEQSYDQYSFFLMAGPCVVESGKGAMDIASTISAWCQALAIPYVFKASYRKANRTSASSFTGIGDRKALEILQQIRTQIKVPVVTDIHTAEEAKLAAPYVDILQIPAFLCRQTDLLLAAAETGKIINIKKGQFLSGPAMRYAVEKITNTGNEKVLLTERGTTFGYQDLVVDFRNIPWMQDIGVPVVMDVTHALQQPNQSSGVTGGNPQLIGTLAKAAIATGADGLFIETHPNPSLAKSDGANMLPLNQLQPLLKELINIKKAISINVNPQ